MKKIKQIIASFKLLSSTLHAIVYFHKPPMRVDLPTGAVIVIVEIIFQDQQFVLIDRGWIFVFLSSSFCYFNFLVIILRYSLAGYR